MRQNNPGSYIPETGSAAPNGFGAPPGADRKRSPEFLHPGAKTG